MSEDDGLEVIKHSNITVLQVGRRFANIDELKVRELRETVIAAGQAADPPLVVMDLSHTKYFGSTFIEVLLRIGKGLLSRDGGRLAFCGLSEYCQEVFEITNLNRLWELYETRDEALEALQKTPK